MIFRIYYERRGPHVHCRIFRGEGETQALSGKLVMSLQQFDALMPSLPGADSDGPAQFYFLPEMRNASVDDPATEDIVATWLSLPTAMRSRARLREALDQADRND